MARSKSTSTLAIRDVVSLGRNSLGGSVGGGGEMSKRQEREKGSVLQIF